MAKEKKEKKQKSLKVMVVEDEASLAAILCQSLKYAGYEIIQAMDGEEALAKVESNLPDIIILDIMMPKVDGWEVCRRLKSSESCKDIPIVMYSTLSQRKDRDKGVELGVAQYISKDRDFMEVIKAIRNIVG